MSEIIYRVCPKYPETHLFLVHCIIPEPKNSGQKLFLPNWIPGSYLIRNFSKHVVSIQAEAKNKIIPLRMLDKNTWQCEAVEGPLSITYQIYALDLTPRGAYLDNQHAFFNGSRLFLCAKGFENNRCLLDILPAEELKYRQWQVATSFTPLKIDALGYGRYSAENYDELIDHPLTMGNFEKTIFQVKEVPHELVITGRHFADIPRFTHDLKKLCEYHLDFFGAPLPIDRYLFLLTLLKGGVGGLEHRNAACLQGNFEQLPRANDTHVSPEYRALLGLFSHEYFHLWNVKRIKLQAFSPYNLNEENYTRLLWVFEGITSYYDELSLVRTALITRESYLELLSELITRVFNTPGRLKQSLEQASFEAWTKFYQPDENSLNTTISYYSKGALVAMALDLLLRSKTKGNISLDTVMKAFWNHYGLQAKPVPEDGFEKLASEISGIDLTTFFDQTIRGVTDPPLAELLETVGIELEWQAIDKLSEQETNLVAGGSNALLNSNVVLNRKAMLEIKLKGAGSFAEIASVFSNSAAELAGLAPNDSIIAVNGMRVDRNNLEAMIAHFNIGDKVILHVFRRDELLSVEVVLRPASYRTCKLKVLESISASQQKQLNEWLWGCGVNNNKT